jgi:tetratricopeptide (TPR) repeat protein
MNRRTRNVGLVIAVLALVAAGVMGWTWWRAEQREALLVQALPEAPEFSGWPAELKHRIDACYRRIRAGERGVETLGELSRLFHANGFLAEASECYVALETVEPKEPRWPHRHATIYAGYGQAEEALERWRRVVRLAPDYLPARLRLGDLLLKANALDEAAQVYMEILQRQPNEPYAQLGLARGDVEAERWTQARDRLERIVAQTNYQLGYDLIVTVYERLGQHDRATAVRGQSLASGAYRDFPDPWLDQLFDDCYDLYQLSLTAGFAERAGDTATAVRRLERALRFDGENHSLHFQLGLTYFAMKDTAKARHHLEQSTVLDPKFSDAWAHLSNLHAVAGDQPAANRVLAAGLRHNPDSYGLRLMRARRLKEAGRMPEAIKDYQLAIEARPNSPDAFIELAMAYFSTEAMDEAIAQLHHALAAEPEHPTALSTLAMHAISVGDEPAARQWIQRCRAQPRVRPEHLQTVVQNFQNTFGRAP